MVRALDYSLPDRQLLNEGRNQFLVWIPDKRYVILGASNNPEEALFTENVEKDNIVVLKRPSGGQTVMLTPGNIILSVVVPNEKGTQPLDLFRNINSLVIDTLIEEGVRGLSLSGISDIAVKNKKIAGSAIYRRQDKLLFHSVINIDEDPSIFERYLRHPSKEPDYRNGRSHADFVVSLRDCGLRGSTGMLAQHLSQRLTQYFTPFATAIAGH